MGGKACVTIDIKQEQREILKKLDLGEDGMAGMPEGNMHDLTCEVLKFRLEDSEDLHSR